MADEKKNPQQEKSNIPNPKIEEIQHRSYSDLGDFGKVVNREIMDTTTIIQKGSDSTALSIKNSNTED